MTAPVAVDDTVVTVDAANSSGDGSATRVLRRYEVAFATVAAIVVVVRMAGGGFIADVAKTVAPLAAPVVAPFVGTADAGGQGGTAQPEPTLPAEIQAVLPSGPVPAAVRSAVTPTTPVAAKSNAPVIAASGAAATATPSATAFADSGTMGDSSVLATVPSPGAPTAVVVGGAGDIWVGTDNGGGQGADGPSVLLHYGADGALLRTVSLPGAQGVTALAAGPAGALYLTARAPAAVFAFDIASGAIRKLADIPDATPCVPPVVAANCDGSVSNAAPVPSALAVDKSGSIYVADSAQGAIWKVAPDGGAVAQFTVDRDWTNPARPAGPSALAFDGSGNLVIAVRSMLTEDAGAVYLQAVSADGSAGPLQELARTDQGARPAGLALGASGKIYVTLSGAGRVLVLGADGKEIARTPASTHPGLDTPAGIAFRGHSLIVAAQTPTNPNGGQVARLPVGEAGALHLAS
jgi:sugar lactone lactonase YvrE